MRNIRVIGLLALLATIGVACADETPTSISDDQLPATPITVELELSWNDFASNLEVFGGYGAPAELGAGVLANQFAGTLTSHTLSQYGAYPVSVSVRDTTGTTRPDSNLTYIGGRVVAFFDTIASTNEGPVTLRLGALQEEWDSRTVTWETAVDTINDNRSWSQPGGGTVVDLGTTVWDPAEGDSAWFEVDSAQIAAWSDTTDASRGARLEILTEGSRVQVRTTALRLNTRPSLNPDSTFFLIAPQRAITFIYDPFPEPPPDGIRVGGAPAWRTVFDIAMPAQLNGPAELCDAVGCPVVLDPTEVNFAALVLQSRQTERAFQPTDTIGVDIRPVLSRSALPKAPLGNSLVGATGRLIDPGAFGDDEGTVVEVPITLFAQDLVRGTDASGGPAPNTLALLSIFEPVSISFASFFGPGTEQAPKLKLIVTVARSVEHP